MTEQPPSYAVTFNGLTGEYKLVEYKHKSTVRTIKGNSMKAVVNRMLRYPITNVVEAQ